MSFNTDCSWLLVWWIKFVLSSCLKSKLTFGQIWWLALWPSIFSLNGSNYGQFLSRMERRSCLIGTLYTEKPQPAPLALKKPLIQRDLLFISYHTLNLNWVTKYVSFLTTSFYFLANLQLQTFHQTLTANIWCNMKIRRLIADDPCLWSQNGHFLLNSLIKESQCSTSYSADLSSVPFFRRRREKHSTAHSVAGAAPKRSFKR